MRGSVLMWALCFAFALFAGSGCSRSIGDACTSNVECNPLGSRFCDLASPGGYCTVEGCDSDSCPDSSICVRFFSLKKAQGRCAVARAARADCGKNPSETGCCVPGSAGCCQLGETCLCDEEGCTEGYCASESSERRWCMKGCDGDGDCRDGYRCVPTGASGSLAVGTRNDDRTIDLPTETYCAPSK